MHNLNFQRQLEEYGAYHERLTLRSVRLIEKMASPEMRFIDPGHDVRGLDAVEAAFIEILGNERVSIGITDMAWGRDGYTGYMRWTRNFPKHKMDGISEVIFGPDGLVVQQTDYWLTQQSKRGLFSFLK
jgi:hypothetical protein